MAVYLIHRSPDERPSDRRLERVEEDDTVPGGFRNGWEFRESGGERVGPCAQAGPD